MSTRRLVVSVPGLPKIGLYVSLLALPGGFIGLLLVYWLERRIRGDSTKGKTRMWYSQMRGWRDLLPSVWRLVASSPRLNLETAASGPAQERVEMAPQYRSA